MTDGIDGALVDAFLQEASAAGVVMHGAVPRGRIADVVSALADRTERRLLAWEPAALGIDDAWDQLRAADLSPIAPTLPGEAAERARVLATLDDVDLGLTSVVAALADTGTCVVAGGRGRPRLAWLLPARHVVIVDPRRVVADMATFFAGWPDEAFADAAHLAFVTGPSRTADIELTLTRGVHGPREVHLILLAD